MSTKILTFALLMTTMVTFGQVEQNSKDRSRFGIRGGVNYSNISYSGDVDFKPKVGFSIGGIYHVISGKKLSLPVELLYSRVGSSSDYADYNFSILNINFMGNYYLNKNIFLEGGLVTGLYLSAKEDSKVIDSNVNIMEDMTPADVSLALGAGYEFTNRVFVNLRYSYGLLPMFISDEEGSHLSNLSLNVGYTF